MLPTPAHFPYRVSSRTCWWGCCPVINRKGTLLFCCHHEGVSGVLRAGRNSEQREHQALVSGVGGGFASSPKSKLCELSVESLLCLLS